MHIKIRKLKKIVLIIFKVIDNYKNVNVARSQIVHTYRVGIHFLFTQWLPEFRRDHFLGQFCFF